MSGLLSSIRLRISKAHALVYGMPGDGEADRIQRRINALGELEAALKLTDALGAAAIEAVAAPEIVRLTAELAASRELGDALSRKLAKMVDPVEVARTAQTAALEEIAEHLGTISEVAPELSRLLIKTVNRR